MKRVHFSEQVKTYTPVLNNNTFYLLKIEPLVSEEDICVRSSPFQSERKQIRKYMHSIHIRRKEKMSDKKQKRLQELLDRINTKTCSDYICNCSTWV